MKEKVIGYSLVGVGLIIMIFCVINVVMVFTNKAEPFPVFNTSENKSSAFNINDIASQINSGNPNALNQALPKFDILPPGVLDKTLNFSTHFFLMSFVLGFGYKIASLGMQFVRPINVKLRSSPETPLPNLPPPPPPPTVH